MDALLGEVWRATLGDRTLLIAASVPLAYLAYRLIWAFYVMLYYPIYFNATSAHLRGKAPIKRGLVTRNLPKGAYGTGRERPAYPNGWFFVEQSSELLRGHVRHVSMLGLELAAFRDDDGEVHVLDAYCPHLGANMAIGGRVVGKCLECPFHGWQFRGSDGTCQHIPGAKKVPEAANTHNWPVVERNGSIFLWHHAEDTEPDWYPQQMEEYATEGITQPCGRTEHVVYTCLQDIQENGADMAHFEPVHRAFASAGSDLRDVQGWLASLVSHTWHLVSPWKPVGPPDNHLTTTLLHHDLYIGKHRLPLSHFEVSVTQVGPGIVYLTMQNKTLGTNMLLCFYIVPEEPLKQRVTHVLYTRPGVLNRLFGKLSLTIERVMVERDIQIWNNKCCRPKPVFAATVSDEALLKFRRWHAQFYTNSCDSSLRKSEAAEDQRRLDW